MVAHFHGMEGVESSNLFRSTLRGLGLNLFEIQQPDERSEEAGSRGEQSENL